MASEFKCTKAIFIPTRIDRRESALYDAFIDYYGYDIYTREKPLLTDIYDYIQEKSSRKSPSFCSKGKGVGVANTYLPEYMLKIIDGNDATTTIMCCYNKDNNQPYSILLYKYDEKKNSIYIATVCADQTTGEESKGSGYLLIKNLIDAVSDTGVIEYIYLHAVPSAVPTYIRNGFKEIGNTDETDLKMVEMEMRFQIPDVDEPSSESLGKFSTEYNPPHTPEYDPHTPEYDPHTPPGPPVYNPGSPVYNLGSPVYNPYSSTSWGDGSPVYKPESPVYNPGSPVYNPYFPVDDPENDVIESNGVVPYGGRRSSHKPKKRTCCKTIKTKKRNCKTKKRNYKTKKRSNRNSSSKIVR